MANEKWLISRSKLVIVLAKKFRNGMIHYDDLMAAIADIPTLDAVEVPDNKLLRAINLLIKQYEHSKNSEYVHHPIAHAFFHTWKQLDGRRE